MYIQGLKTNTAVKVGGHYVVELQHGMNTDYEIDGAPIGNKRQIVVNNLDDIVKINKHPRKLIHWEDAEGNQYSIKFVMEIQNRYLDDEFEDREYPDLDSQIEHIKQLDWIKNDLTPVYEEPKQEREKVNVEVVGYLEDTGSDFIESAIQFGKSDWGKSGGVYKVSLSGIARDEVMKYVNKYDKVEVPKHGNIEYAKVEGKYPFNKQDKSWISKPIENICTSLDSAKEIEKSVRDFVSSRMDMYVKPKNLNEVTLVDADQKLKHIESNVRSMKLMKSSSGSKSSVIKAIEELRLMLCKS